MSTVVDNDKREVTFLYKLVEGNAESSHGTRSSLCPSRCTLLSPSMSLLADFFSRSLIIFTDVAHLAGVPLPVVTRAEEVSKTFFLDLQGKLAKKRRSALPLVAHADFAFLFKLGSGTAAGAAGKGAEKEVLGLLRQSVGRYERTAAVAE